jgi:hypothetical protein
MMYFPLHVVLHRLTECILAHELEVFRSGIHLSPLHISYNNKDIVAAMVVHAPQEHEFGELDGLGSSFFFSPRAKFMPPNAPS